MREPVMENKGVIVTLKLLYNMLDKPCNSWGEQEHTYMCIPMDHLLIGKQEHVRKSCLE